jgi:hypothetical protein
MTTPMTRRGHLTASVLVLALAQAGGTETTRVEAQQASGADAPRAGSTAAIEGRVVDAEGRPVTWARVQAVRRLKYWNGPFYESTVGVADETDDRGQFRLHSLPAGTYVVAAVPPTDGASVYRRTYHPETAALGRAEPVAVGEGAKPVVTIRLERVTVVRVTGIVFDANGMPVPNQSVSALGPYTSEDGDVWRSQVHRRPAVSSVSAADGTFALNGLSPGQYVLSAFNTRGRREPGDPFTLSEATITVGTTPIEGLRVVLQPAATVRGRFEWAGTGPAPWPAERSIGAIRLHPVGRPTDLGGLQTQVGPDGSFEFRALYGLRGIQDMGLPLAMAIDALSGDPAVRDRWFIDVQPGTDVHDLRVVVTNARAMLFADVVDEHGSPFVPEQGAFGGSVLVMPVSPTAPDTRYWGFYHASHVYEGNAARRIARIDKVRSGRYLMAAIDVEPGRLTGDTELMERARAAASLVDVPIGSFDVRLPIVRLRQYVREPVRTGP